MTPTEFLARIEGLLSCSSDLGTSKKKIHQVNGKALHNHGEAVYKSWALGGGDIYTKTEL